jgi:toxin FitB
MNYLLDTCVLFELMKPEPDPMVIDWLQNTPSNRLFLSVLTLGELRKTISGLPDSSSKTALVNWLATLVENYRDRILPVTPGVAENWGIIQLHAEKTSQTLSCRNSLMVAVAYTHHLILVTRHKCDYEIGIIPFQNPWSQAKETCHENKEANTV